MYDQSTLFEEFWRVIIQPIDDYEPSLAISKLNQEIGILSILFEPCSVLLRFLKLMGIPKSVGFLTKNDYVWTVGRLNEKT